jgi:glutamyl-tRNA reductase
MNPMLQRLGVWSLSVRDGDDAASREQAARLKDRLGDLAASWLGNASAHSSFLFVSTCHRVELYFFDLDPEQLRKDWGAVSLQPTRLHLGLDAVRHLMRVSSSLASEVLGETQITGQIRDAAAAARSAGWLRGPLDRSVQNALRVAKKIRTQTQIGEGTVSVAHAAIDGLADVFESLESKSMLILGAGSMASQVYDRVRGAKLKTIYWANRSMDRLQKRQLGTEVRIVPFADRHSLAWSADIVVAATQAPEPIVSKQALSEARPKGSDSRTRVVLDLGLPRNVEPEIHLWKQFLLRNVDEFNDHAAAHLEKRKHQAKIAEALLEQEAQDFVNIWNIWEKGPLIGELYTSVEALWRLELDELDVEQKSKIEYAIQSTYGKLMHRLVTEVESLEDNASMQVLQTLVRAWRQPDQWQLRNQNPKPLRKKG